MEPTTEPGMPSGEEQEVRFSLCYFIFLPFLNLIQDSNTRPYGFRQSTLTARSAEPNLTRQLNPTQNRPKSRAQGTVDNTSKDLVKEAAQQLQEKNGEDSAPPMPPVSKSRNARSGDNPVTAGSKCLFPFMRPLLTVRKQLG